MQRRLNLGAFFLKNLPKKHFIEAAHQVKPQRSNIYIAKEYLQTTPKQSSKGATSFAPSNKNSFTLIIQYNPTRYFACTKKQTPLLL
ncbi:hypothetical protein [Flavobacterium sp. CFS9]|uniref:hypothetical protein n=1 Tax=Flavobacterium sp. CFS9 TaxID=3143118 RepID=UPI0034E8B2D7